MTKRASDLKVADIKEKYINSKTEAREWPHGSKHGEEPLHCSPAMDHQIQRHLDGQYGSTILDNQSWERMEGVCSK